MRYLRRTKKSVVAQSIEAGGSGDTSARPSPKKSTPGIQTRSRVIPTPQVRPISQDPPASDHGASSSPSSRGPPPKKQKTSEEVVGFNDKEFDALGWVE